MMIRYLNIVLLVLLSPIVIAQGSSDATVITDSDRSVERAYRLRERPKTVDTIVPSPVTQYPLLVLREDFDFEVNPITPATIRHLPQLSQLYRGYAKIGGGSRLMGLGEVYYNSTRSRKYNWGIHAQHLSEWGQISDYAPSQYDRTTARAFGEVHERRYTYGGELKYRNQGLHYYGFENSNASRDSIAQRFNTANFSGFYKSHVKDSAALNYTLGLDYTYFTEARPSEEEMANWFAQEHFVGLNSNWQYKSSNNLLLSNMSGDFNIHHNDYRYGIMDSTMANGVDSGLVSTNTIVYLKPMVKLYGKNEKLQLRFGGELAIDIQEDVVPSLYPVAQVSYSLFDDLFIPYLGVDGGLVQQRFELLALQNEFIRTNLPLENMQRYAFNFGIKGTLSKRMSFNVGANFSSNRNHALFVNDTIHSSGNRFGVIYDTISISTLTGSLSYQHNERLKIDGILQLHNYQARNNPYAWNLPQLELIARGSYNIADKLLLNLDITFEGGRRAVVYDPTLPNVKEYDGVYTVPLGLVVDGNLGVEYRYSKRVSFFMNVNNFAAQRYQRWFNYPVQAFQFMMGATFRF